VPEDEGAEQQIAVGVALCYALMLGGWSVAAAKSAEQEKVSSCRLAGTVDTY